MIRFRLRELILDLEFKQQKRIPMETIALGTGIKRPTLYKIATTFGYNTTTENLDRLCKYFECEWKDLAEYVPDDDVVQPAKKKTGRPTKKTSAARLPAKAALVTRQSKR